MALVSDELSVRKLFGFASAPQGTSARRLAKIAFTGIGMSVTGVAVVYWFIYPLKLTQTTGFYQQIPAYFWVLLGLLSVFSVMFVYFKRSAWTSLVATIMTFFALNVHNALFYGVTGGDMIGENNDVALMNNYVHLDPSISPLFHYLQWPVKYIHHIQIQRILGTELIPTASIGYALYFFVFTVAVWLFAYRYTNEPFFAYAAASLYLILAITWLNNQFVPQFLGFIFLIYLFSLHNRNGLRWKITLLLLYIALILTHPILFFFFIAAEFATPFFKHLKYHINKTNQYIRVYRTPVLLIRKSAMTIQTLPKLFQVYWPQTIRWMTLLGGIYVLFFLFRFHLFQESVFFTLTRAPDQSPAASATVGRYIETLLSLGESGGGTSGGGALAGESGGGTSGGSVNTGRLLYTLTSRTTVLLTDIGVRLVVGVAGVCSMGLLLSQRVKDIESHTVAILVVGGGYFIAGIFANILGLRVLQIVFLPLTLSIIALKNRPRIALILIVLILIFSPVIGANQVVSKSITGGKTAEDFHANMAGKTLDSFGHGAVIRPWYTTYPTRGSDRESIQISAIRTQDAARRPLVVFTPRMQHFARYKGLQCDLSTESEHNIYDNGRAIILWQSTNPDFFEECRLPNVSVTARLS